MQVYASTAWITTLFGVDTDTAVAVSSCYSPSSAFGPGNSFVSSFFPAASKAGVVQQELGFHSLGVVDSCHIPTMSFSLWGLAEDCGTRGGHDDQVTLRMLRKALGPWPGRPGGAKARGGFALGSCKRPRNEVRRARFHKALVKARRARCLFAGRRHGAVHRRGVEPSVAFASEFQPLGRCGCQVIASVGVAQRGCVLARSASALAVLPIHVGR